MTARRPQSPECEAPLTQCTALIRQLLTITVLHVLSAVSRMNLNIHDAIVSHSNHQAICQPNHQSVSWPSVLSFLSIIIRSSRVSPSERRLIWPRPISALQRAVCTQWDCPLARRQIKRRKMSTCGRRSTLRLPSWDPACGTRKRTSSLRLVNWYLNWYFVQ